MTPKKRAQAEQRIRDAMANLVGNPEFAQFINVVREQREIAIEDACTDAVVASQRASMAAIGEVRAYKTIIDTYDEYAARRLDESEPVAGDP